MQESESFITIKESKDNFSHKILSRPINTLKSDICKVTKQILHNINIKICSPVEFD